MKLLIRYAFPFLFICILTTGCTKRHVQIDRHTRTEIDTLAAREINGLRPLMDSLCLVSTDSLVDVMRDSILTSRREEMRKLLGR